MRLDTSLLDAAPVSLLKVGVVAMAVLDASFLFGHLSDHQNVADSLPCDGAAGGRHAGVGRAAAPACRAR